jgi:hypothetical protein
MFNISELFSKYNLLSQFECLIDIMNVWFFLFWQLISYQWVNIDFFQRFATIM